MNESKTKKQRYWLAILLDDLALDQTFAPDRLHVTIIPWFVSGLTESEIIGSFISEFEGTAKFDLKVGETAMFGPDHDVEVYLIEPEPHVMQLHQQALAWFERMTHRWAVIHPHINDEYRPHVRKRPNSQLNQGQIIPAGNIYLIAADRQENNIRRVAAKIPLL